MDRDLSSCRACREPVPAAATTCPSCGYDVARHDRWRIWLGAVGTALTVSVVAAPLGLPLLWAAHRHRLAASGTVAAPASAGLREHLSSVLRRHVGLETTTFDGGELHRGGSRDGLDVPPGPP